MQGVERFVAGQDPVNELAVAVYEALDGKPDIFLGHAAHFEQAGLKLLQLLLKVPNDARDRFHHPNRPVT